MNPTPTTWLRKGARWGRTLATSAVLVSATMALLGGLEALVRVPAESPHRGVVLAYGAYLSGFAALPLCLVASSLSQLVRIGKRSGTWLPSALAGLFFAALVFGAAVVQTHPDQILGESLSRLNPFLPSLFASLLAAALVDRRLQHHTWRPRLPSLRWVGLAGTLPLLAAGAVFSAAYAPASADDTVYTAADDPHAGARPASRKPDIVWVIVDTLRADAVALDDGEPTWTPSLAALGQAGLVYTNAVSTASWTGTSFGSMYSASGAEIHGCLDVQDPLSDSVTTVAEVLQEGGYRTVAIHNNANVSHRLGFGQGFLRFVEASTQGRFPPAAAKVLALQRALGNPQINTLGRGKWARQHYAPADTVLQRAREELALASSDPRPLFLVVHLMEPHSPYFRHPEDGTGLQPDPSRSDRADLWSRYLGEVWWMDAQLAGFWETLQASGVWDDAVIVVSGDHGEEFQEHGGWWHGTTLFEEVTRVPLVLKPPTGTTLQPRVDDRVTTMDIAPTVAALAGVARPQTWQGTPLPPFGTGTRHPQASQRFRGKRQRAVWAGDWKLVDHQQETPELYDLGVDPLEQSNLATGRPGEAARLSSLLPAELPTGSTRPTSALDCATCASLKALGYIDSCDGCLPP